MILRHEGEWPPAPSGLVQHGPLVNVTLGHKDDYAGMESRRPAEFPSARMMIDTGAAFTVIEEPLAFSLGLRPVRFREVIGVDRRPVERPVFPMSVVLVMHDGLGNRKSVRFKVDIVGVPRAQDEGYVGLLGRDFLQHFELLYDGPKARFSLIRDRSRLRRR
ncbi:MAG: hypothetical protein ACI9OJ_002058 [Myxococcota bacterium]